MKSHPTGVAGPRHFYIPAMSWPCSQVHWSLDIDSHWAGNFWVIAPFISGQPIMMDLSKIFNSLTSPLEVKSGWGVTNGAQKSLSLLFPKQKLHVKGERGLTHYGTAFTSSCLPVDQHWQRRGRRPSLSLAAALIDSSPPGGQNLQKAVTLGCYFPFLKARVSLSHQDWLQKEQK